MKNIFITTLGRPRVQDTIKNLSPDVLRRTVLVVQAHELGEHRWVWGDHPYLRTIMALPEEIKTLGPTRAFLHDFSKKSGFERYILLDDDLKFYARRDPKDWHLSKAEPEEVTRMFLELEGKLNAGYKHASISGREGNNRIPEYGKENTRYMRVLGYRTDFPEGVVPGRIDGMSDFDLSLQLLRKGCASYTLFRYAQGQPGTQTAGGCSINRTHETHDREIDFMVKEHAPFVKKRMKVNKTGGEFGTRNEVTVFWGRAFEQGAKWADTHAGREALK